MIHYQNNAIINVKYFVIILLILSSLQVCYAHGDLHARIQQLTIQIEENPDSTYLYLKRGILYFQHEEFPESLVDLKICESRKYKDKLLDLTIAKVYHKLNDYDNSLEYLLKIIEIDHKYVHAWRLSGLVYMAKGDYRKSAQAYLNVIEKAIQRLPSNYIDASIAYELIENEEGIQSSIQIIKAGIKDLGPLVTFHERLVEIGRKHQQYDLAIDHQSSIISESNRKEAPLFKRANIYVEQGENEKALADLKLAIEALEMLPQRHQKTPAMIELRKKIHSTQQKLNLKKSE